jgi:hypothetical protein
MERARGFLGRLAKVLGKSERTLRRWQGAEKEPPPRPPPSRDIVGRIEEIVRNSKGLIGVEALRRMVPGLSRRQVRAIKKRVCREMELKRRRESRRLTVKAPGILRGFDQLYVPTTEGNRIVLFGSDGSIPFRTSYHIADAYDGDNVLRAISRDIERHGAPLVWRMDNASAHTVQPVLDLLGEHQILLLQGPPHHPLFYGQTERQNREHRAWLRAGPLLTADSIEPDLHLMLQILNCEWRRRTLGWRTSAELWSERPKLRVDRTELKEEVTDLASRIRREDDLMEDRKEDAAKLSWRLAIERALINRGLIELVSEGWC